ncbi:MerR family transcriptional regulator [Candidatus Terasakiella magnetica]|uniref:MerR family transcriptional regulator n=1 Tax=Candidatus Terasakiella magnetica TaxID=1867952 RepID=A0A1C3RDP8_9PROT|nr:helix-turn-helix domain-containing protein [Candidatus Terasakiella magnetica]SCA55420.1 MerR family transcriptional regulator [Candidatus Terasakiella magnetica]
MGVSYTIGKVAKATGCKVPTIRYYEEIGILAPAERTAGNQRVFSQKHLDRLLFIRHARDLGFSLEAIRQLLRLSDDPDQSCEAADAIAREQLGEVDKRISKLKALKKELQHMITQCKGGRISDCRIIEVISTHQS